MKQIKIIAIVLLSVILLSYCSFNYFAISPQKVFENKNFIWSSDSSQHIKYYFSPNSIAAKEIDTIKKKSEQYIVHILSLIHEDIYTKQISLIFTESRLKMKELTMFENNGMANWKYNAVYYVYGDSLKAFGEHEFNHVIVTNLWGENGSYRWLSEGFAVFSDDSWGKYNLHCLCKYFLDNNKFISLHDLLNNFNNYKDLVTYPEAGSFVKYLYEKYGYQKFKNLWQDGEGNLEKIYGKQMNELEKEWIDVINNYDAKGIKYKI